VSCRAAPAKQAAPAAKQEAKKAEAGKAAAPAKASDKRLSAVAAPAAPGALLAFPLDCCRRTC
jgi:hypothetical protein